MSRLVVPTVGASFLAAAGTTDGLRSWCFNHAVPAGHAVSRVSAPTRSFRARIADIGLAASPARISLLAAKHAVEDRIPDDELGRLRS